MLNLTFISYFLYDEVTKNFEIPLCNYLINAVTVKETKPTHLHNEPLILFLHGHVVITDWGCVYACVCVCVCVCERRGIIWRTEGEGGRESKLKENFTSMATRLFRLPCLLSSSSILTEPGITSTALWSVLHRRSERQIITAVFHSEPSCIAVMWDCGSAGGWVCLLGFYSNIRLPLLCIFIPELFLGW